ncbi:hypothetical protein ACOJ0Y_15265 [Morganella morganii]|uniref:hypothetical protein n=1 Tax=Morganella morganii TaxID=582 RepID=UPI003B6806A8
MATITVIPKKDNAKNRRLAKQMAFWDRKREEYAAKAMQGILSNNSMIDTATESTFEWVTKNAYQLADAMLRTREK